MITQEEYEQIMSLSVEKKAEMLEIILIKSIGKEVVGHDMALVPFGEKLAGKIKYDRRNPTITGFIDTFSAFIKSQGFVYKHTDADRYAANNMLKNKDISGAAADRGMEPVSFLLGLVKFANENEYIKKASTLVDLQKNWADIYNAGMKKRMLEEKRRTENEKKYIIDGL